MKRKKTCIAVLNRTDGILWWECSNCGELIHKDEKKCLVCNGHVASFECDGKHVKNWLKIKTI